MKKKVRSWKREVALNSMLSVEYHGEVADKKQSLKNIPRADCRFVTAICQIDLGKIAKINADNQCVEKMIRYEFLKTELNTSFACFFGTMIEKSNENK